MGYRKSDGKNNSRAKSILSIRRLGAERDGAGRVTERRPGMSRETTDRERDLFCLFKCVYVCVCGLHPRSPVVTSGTEMWFQLGRFFSSSLNQKHTGTSNKLEIFLPPTLICCRFTANFQTSPTISLILRCSPPSFFFFFYKKEHNSL